GAERTPRTGLLTSLHRYGRLRRLGTELLVRQRGRRAPKRKERSTRCEMSGLAWLHLSDWHQQGRDFHRTKVRDALLHDLQERETISPNLKTLDFVIFSGDLVYHGLPDEYRTAAGQFLDPVLKAVGVPRERLVVVPGNHDVEWDLLDVLPA